MAWNSNVNAYATNSNIKGGTEITLKILTTCIAVVSGVAVADTGLGLQIVHKSGFLTICSIHKADPQLSGQISATFPTLVGNGTYRLIGNKYYATTIFLIPINGETVASKVYSVL